MLKDSKTLSSSHQSSLTLSKMFCLSNPIFTVVISRVNEAQSNEKITYISRTCSYIHAKPV